MADIAEEVIRIYGYDRLNNTLPSNGNTVGQKNKKQSLEDKLKALLVNSGYQEMYSYSFLSPKDLEKCNIADEEYHIKVKNPLGEDFSIMRTSILPTMLQSVATNYLKKNKNVKLFEIGRTFIDKNKNVEKGDVPEEIYNVAFISYGNDIEFYAVKNTVENMLEASNIKKYEVLKEENNFSMHPGKTAKITIGKDVIATFGEVHPQVVSNYEIGEKVYFACLDLNKLTKYGRDGKKYSPIPKYPALERDIAVIIDENVEVGEIEKVITKRAKNMLESIELFDIYRNEKLGEGKKSVAYSLNFRTLEKTLTDEEINDIMEVIVSDLEKQLGAELRK
jgi:phenylalanyl-tRNA synthetase beta chain